jgi:protoheme IX farnesyltransferase
MKIESAALPAAHSRVADFVSLTKPRLNFLVVATSAAGYYLGAASPLDAIGFFNTVAGTALVAGGSSVFNQIFERDVDALMTRTRLRPLPDGRVAPAEAALFGALLSAAGLLMLALGSTLLAAGVALATLVSYVLIYTPLKRRTSLATVVGAVPGALPPVIGWAGATGVVSREAWLLFAIVFLWQMPHFLAIAWMFRDDYARAGFPMLPVIHPDGRSTARQATAYAAALVPVSLMPAAIGMTSWVYFAGALLLGLAFLTLGIRFARRLGEVDARALFLGSITYLPLVWVLMIATRG